MQEWSTFEGVITVTWATLHAVAAEYLQSTLKGTPTWSSHSSTALYETYVASQEDSGCVFWMQDLLPNLNMTIKIWIREIFGNECKIVCVCTWLLGSYD